MPGEYTFSLLQQIGVFDIILPFILVFTIVYAVLQKIKLFGEESKKFNVVIALVMGAAVIVPHVLQIYPPEKDIVNIINGAMPQISVILVAAVMFLLILGVLGKKVALGGASLSGFIAFIAAIIVIYIFGEQAGWWVYPYWLGSILNPDTQALVVVILVFAIIIWFITKEPPKEGGDKKRFFESIGKGLFGEEKQ